MVRQVTIKDRLVALDSRMLGGAKEAERQPAPRWVTVVAALAPVLAGGTAAVAYFVDHAAGVGVIIGLLFAVPIAAVVRASARR